MPIVFEKSARANVGERLMSATIVLIVMAAFSTVFVLPHNLPIIVSIFAAGGIFVSVIVLVKIAKEAHNIWKSGQSWRVEITDKMLIWGSPVQDIMEPIEIALKDISATRRVFITKQNSKVRPKNKYFIDLKDGRSIEVSDQLSAIAPTKVFEALQDHGIEYRQTNAQQGGSYKIISGS